MSKLGGIKNRPNIFTKEVLLKEWAMDLSDACGSKIINKSPNISKIDALIQKFVDDYNLNMRAMVDLKNSEEE